jgi:hypothetical protein
MADLKITLVITDTGNAMHIGGDVERRAIQFDMPPEIQQAILQHRGEWKQLSLVITEVHRAN